MGDGHAHQRGDHETDARLEPVAQHLIDSPEDVLPRAKGKSAEKSAERQAREKVWREFSKDRLREAGILALRNFKNPANVERLKNLLNHPAMVGNHGSDVREFYLRRAVWEMLREWQVKVEKPVLVETEKAADK